jgi:hypothetical protein
MARAPKLKVFRMPVGFHDAYVAAPSQKAAAAAWGADVSVFARGEAELVTDPDLMEAALAAPGTVVKRLRGTAAEQIAALGEEQYDGREARPKTGGGGKPVRKPKPKPKPSRAPLEEAEEALSAAEARHAREREAMAEREAALARERAETERRQREERERLQARRDKAEADFAEAMRRWRG